MKFRLLVIPTNGNKIYLHKFHYIFKYTLNNSKSKKNALQKIDIDCLLLRMILINLENERIFFNQ